MKKLILLWILCAPYNWGATLGSFTHEFPWDNNVAPALIMTVSGPFGTVVATVMDHPFHWLLRPYSTEERWEYFHKEWPDLSREEFEMAYD